MVSNKIILKGIPKSTNHLYRYMCFGRAPRMYLISEGKDLRDDYQKQLKRQWFLPPLQGNVAVEIWLFFKDKRKRDWDNYHKLSMDACNKILWKDDSQIVYAVVHKEVDKNNPRIEIVLQYENDIA